jgi:putative endonuclease
MTAKDNLYLGKAGEEEAARLLKDNGYKILARNYKSKFGEIDIIAKDKDTFCFIEVKTRQTDRFGMPQEAVLKSKQRKISRVAVNFLKVNNLLNERARFDVVSVVYSDKGVRPDLIKNAFELDGRVIY